VSDSVTGFHRTIVNGETLRGFPAPSDLAERTLHEDDDVLIVRLSKYERRLLKAETHGVFGRFCLISNRDGSFDLVRYAHA